MSGIDTYKMRAQGYDDAVNMSGVHREVKAVVRQQVPDCSATVRRTHACGKPSINCTEYVTHCKNHDICVWLFSKGTGGLSGVSRSECPSQKKWIGMQSYDLCAKQDG